MISAKTVVKVTLLSHITSYHRPRGRGGGGLGGPRFYVLLQNYANIQNYAIKL